MLTRLIRTQLVIFTVLGVLGFTAMFFQYLQVPRLLGIGHLTVTLELPSSGGLYQFSNVTYRGIQVGKVTDVRVVDGRRVVATMSLDQTPPIPANSAVRIRSVSAVGEQYVDFEPTSTAPPYLVDGSVLRTGPEALPQAVGPMLDRVSALVQSIPTDKISGLLDESYQAFSGSGYDFGSLVDSAATLSTTFNDQADRTRQLLSDTRPVLTGQAETSDALQTWARKLASFTGQISDDDPQVRTILQRGPGFTSDVSHLLEQFKPTLPVLLANMTTVGQVAVTYHASLEQLLVLLPPDVATIQSTVPGNNPTGQSLGDFAITVGDPPPCTVGFLPPSQWRSPADTTTMDTPDGLYCKLPQDSPIAVRGARNYPCAGHPGKRAPTVEICDSDKPFEPLAMRQHAVGPYPMDPNLIAQGVPPDDRVNSDAIYGPLAGTPMPNTPAAPPAADTALPVAPSGFDSGPPGPTPTVAVRSYDPATGTYMAPDGHLYRQLDLDRHHDNRNLEDLMLPE